MFGHRMGGYGYEMGGYGGFFGVLICFLLVVVIVYAIYKLFTNNHHQPKGRQNDALDILKNKYVQGEISEEEYLRKKELINRK